MIWIGKPPLRRNSLMCNGKLIKPGESIPPGVLLQKRLEHFVALGAVEDDSKPKKPKVPKKKVQPPIEVRHENSG